MGRSSSIKSHVDSLRATLLAVEDQVGAEDTASLNELRRILLGRIAILELELSQLNELEPDVIPEGKEPDLTSLERE